MKILIWIGCVVVYSVVVTALKFGGVYLGALPVALLFLLLVLLPAPALCRVIDKKRSAGGESGKSWPAPGEKLCGTPFVKAGEDVPASPAPEPERAVKPKRTRLEIILSVACAVLVLTVAALGYKVYEFREMTVAFVEVNGELLEEIEALEAEAEAAKGGQQVDSYTEGYLEAREQLGLSYYIASKESDVYHRATCEYVDAILERNRTYYLSEESAVADGKIPCSVCRP